MLVAMKSGSVIVDLAAERGGNCALTEQGKTVQSHGVTIIGPENVPATLAFHASQMYGKNIETLLNLILDDEGNLAMDHNDEIVAGTLVAHDGDVPHPHMRKLLDLPALEVKSEPAETSATE
jgi:NAD(P) transhydrogenase subunit alpha